MVRKPKTTAKPLDDDEQPRGKVPAPARVGMTVLYQSAEGQIWGPIIGIGAEFCVFRNASRKGKDDFAPGRLVALAWPDVLLAVVRPDLRHKGK